MMSRSAALFGGTNTAKSGNLVEFRAGKMVVKSDNHVTPDKRPGKVYLHQSEDGLVHFCWKDRKNSSSTAEDEYIIFPEDAIFIRIKKVTSGRVYLLRFRSNPNQKFFFWMQEPNADRDEERVKLLNEYMTTPPSAPTNHGGRRSARGTAANALHARLGGSDVHEMLGSLSLSQAELLQYLTNAPVGVDGGTESHTSDVNDVLMENAGASMLSSTASSSATAGSKRFRPATGGNGNVKFKLEDLQSIFSSIGPSSSSVASGQRRQPLLPDVLKAENVMPLLSSPSVDAALQGLLPLLPETGGANAAESGDRDQQEKRVRSALQSPYFKSAVRVFGSALQSGEMGPVISQFNLGDSVNASASSGDLLLFAQALEDEEKKNSGEEAMDTAQSGSSSEKTAKETVEEEKPSQPEKMEKD